MLIISTVLCGVQWRNKAGSEKKWQGADRTYQRRQKHPGISHHGDRAVDKARHSRLQLVGLEALDPQIHVDVTELEKRRRGKDRRPRKNTKQGVGF